MAIVAGRQEAEAGNVAGWLIASSSIFILRIDALFVSIFHRSNGEKIIMHDTFELSSSPKQADSNENSCNINVAKKSHLSTLAQEINAPGKKLWGNFCRNNFSGNDMSM